MFIAVKQDDRVYVGVSVSDDNIDMTAADLALAENIPLFKINGGTGFAIMDTCALPYEIIRDEKEYKTVELTTTAVVEYAYKYKKDLAEFELLDEEKSMYGGMILVSGGDAFIIDRYFQVKKVVDFAGELGRHTEVAYGSMRASAGKPATERILGAFRLIRAMRHFDAFPVSVYDGATGKRKVYYK